MSELLRLYRDAQKPYEKLIQYCATAPIGPMLYYDLYLDRYHDADQLFVKRILELEAESATLTARITELEGFINQLIEAGELLAECSDYEGGKIAWDALVKDWKEREE